MKNKRDVAFHFIFRVSKLKSQAEMKQKQHKVKYCSIFSEVFLLLSDSDSMFPSLRGSEVKIDRL